MKIISQKQMCFYKLYEEYKKDRERYVPAWEFGGEMFIKELNRWVMMSYKCPARLSDVMNENPQLLQRKEIVGKSGSAYFGYRFVPNVNDKLILDPKLKEFYTSIRKNALSKQMDQA